MTAEERAEKIVTLVLDYRYGFVVHKREELHTKVAAEIASAVAEALEPYTHYTLPNGDEVNILTDCVRLINDAYKHGKDDAYEDAADEIRSYMHEKGLSVELLDLANRVEARAAEMCK